MRVTCGAGAEEAFDIEYKGGGENNQLKSIGMYGFTVADCASMSILKRFTLVFLLSGKVLLAAPSD